MIDSRANQSSMVITHQYYTENTATFKIDRISHSVRDLHGLWFLESLSRGKKFKLSILRMNRCSGPLKKDLEGHS